VLGETIEWRPTPGAEPLTISLPPLFERIHGERL